jgi:crotonobetainyl-CoA:carnitine CoA-transferase CaiB-like acyl-CoA transferase
VHAVGDPTAQHPLHGTTIVDMTTSYAGPTATMLLADMGARVVKVERPRIGDDSRHWGPPFVAGESAWFLSANRNKRSVCVNVSHPSGREVLDKLLVSADVFVQSMNPSKLTVLGIDPDAVRDRHPHLVYCALSGFGLSGPDRERPGYDLIAQARSGLMSVTGEAGRMPQRVSTALSDVVTGMVAALAIAAALRRKALTGEGTVIDVSLLDVDLALMAPRIASYLAGEPEPRPTGATDSVLAVYQSFNASDRPFVVAVGERPDVAAAVRRPAPGRLRRRSRARRQRGAETPPRPDHRAAPGRVLAGARAALARRPGGSCGP